MRDPERTEPDDSEADRLEADAPACASVEFLRARPFRGEEEGRHPGEPGGREHGEDERRHDWDSSASVVTSVVHTSTSPSSRGPGRGPFKAKTRVRIPLGTPSRLQVLRPPRTSPSGPRFPRIETPSVLRWPEPDRPVEHFAQELPTVLNVTREQRPPLFELPPDPPFYRLAGPASHSGASDVAARRAASSSRRA